MALTLAKLTPNPDHNDGQVKRRYLTVTFDSSYPTGGLTFDKTSLNVRKVHHVTSSPALNSQGAGDSTKALIVRWNQGTNKLQAFWQTDPGAAGGAAIAFPEVSNTTDLSTYRCHVEAVCQ